MDSVDMKLITWAEIDKTYIYIWWVIAILTAAYQINKHKVTHRLEVFLLAFFLLTGNLNEGLTFSIPGLSFFEIQPDRLLFFVLTFFLVRKIVTNQARELWQNLQVMPWFMFFLLLYVACTLSSQMFHVEKLGLSDVIVNAIYSFTIIIIILSVQLLSDKATIRTLGNALIIGAAVSSVVSIVQIAIDPMFMKFGDQRIAFGSLFRANGIFNREYFNAYFLIAGIVWVLVTIEKRWLKFNLLSLMSIGVICTFQRMSWVVLLLILVLYFVKIEKVGIDKLVLAGLSVAAIGIAITLLFQEQIMGSTLVKERMSERVDSRFDYYQMVLDNIGKQPVFGYGNYENDVYYYNILRITRSRDRASGKRGDLHSGYFTTMFYHGVPAFLAFLTFITLALFYFGYLVNQQLFYAIPFLLAFIYIVANLTNTMLFDKYLSLIYALHLGIGLGFRKLETTPTSEKIAITPLKQHQI